jgi:[ribosomal protein S18]-alanine N-acetyltransferase
MNIRPAAAEDIAAIIALEKAAPNAAHWPEQSYGAIFEAGTPPRIALVVEDGNPRGANRLKGFLFARTSGPDCDLENIVVASGIQRHGVGSALMHALVAAARARNSKRIFLEVRESNVAARAFYEKCGFSDTGRRKSYYNTPAEDAVVYSLSV